MYKGLFKKLLDLILSTMVLPFWILILIIIAPLIYFEDKGSIFYNSLRLGKDGNTFKMYKFRSMKMNSADIRNEDGSTFCSDEDTRLTRIGRWIRKTSIDETPQLLNILKGEMSIVGPRPDLPEFMNKFTQFEKKKLSVRPGVTGYNQAYFRNNIHLTDKILNDLYYIENISLLFDLKIIFKTIYTVVKRKNVFSTDAVIVNTNRDADTVNVKIQNEKHKVQM